MKPFMFVIRAVPAPQSKYLSTLRGAIVHVWVMSSDLEAAQSAACAYIAKYLWFVKSVESAFEIPQEQIARLGKSESRLYRTALEHGVAADFLGVPLVDGQPDDPVSFEKLSVD